MIIKVEHLTKKYQDFIAINNLSFEVPKGIIFGILGPNGAGKTTTLEIIETIKPKTSGKVFVDGFDLDKNSAAIKNIIGVQLQSAGFYPNLNLIELIQLFSGLYNVKTNSMEVLSWVQLEKKAKAKYKELSGGQKQRFSVATTIIHKPKIVFLDEPTTGLDPHARRNLWELILGLKNKGITVVLTTHYMEEAEYLCDQLIVMDHGEKIAEGSPEELIDNLVQQGFKYQAKPRLATLEDVFIDLTGKSLREA
ncbi:MAG TPA: ABC transporter ATP-binding protein [Chitinophagaceae bacterium]|nr:ABC transporter ATP-binding protein [Chitinophagaceae bacterium]